MTTSATDIGKKHFFRRVILLGFLLVISLVVVLVVSNYYNLSNNRSMIAEIVEQNNTKITMLQQMNSITRERIIVLLTMATKNNDSKIRELAQVQKNHLQNFIQFKKILGDQLQKPQEFVLLKNITSVSQEVDILELKIIANKIAGNDIAQKVENYFNLQQSLIENIDSLMQHQQATSYTMLNGIKTHFDKSVEEFIFMSMITILVAIAIAVYLVSFVSRQEDRLIKANDLLEVYNFSLKETADFAKQINHTKAEFIANMSHELRTPMTAIKGSTGILRSGMIGDIPDDAKKLIKMADENSDVLMELITDVLDFSKMEAGDFDIIEDKISMKYEVDRFLLPYTLRARNKKLKLIVNYHDSLPDSVISDFPHITRVLSHLLNNAIKFTDKGQIELDIRYSEKNNSIIFYVNDTGIGISDESVSMLFESFVQGDGSSTREYGGTGLGLAICKMVANALKGEIGVSSVVNKGSTFWFSVPVRLEEQAA